MPSPKTATRRSVVDLTESAPPYVSPSMEVLQALEAQNTLSSLEARLDSMEIDIARMSGSRDDDARRLAGEMAVMKARVEDALTAFSGTSDELRDLVRSLEKRLDQANPDRPAIGAPTDVRAEITAGLDGIMAGVGDALGTLVTDLRGQIDHLGAQMGELREGMLKIAEHAGGVASLSGRLSEVENVLAELLKTRARQR